MVIGQAPGHKEDELGAPFVGQSGGWLDNLLAMHAQIDLDTVYYTNVNKCYPGRKGEVQHIQLVGSKVGFKPTQKGDRRPMLSEARKCVSTWLLDEIREVKPGLIITVGDAPLAALLPDEKLTQVHGQVLPYELDGETYLLAAMYHPAAAAYNPNLKPVLVNDFKKLHDAWPPPTWDVVESLCIDTEGFGFDLETTTPEVNGKFAPTLAEPIGYATAAENRASYWERAAPPQPLQLLLEDPTVPKWAHNSKFEYMVMKRQGITVRGMEDTKLMAYVLGLPTTELKSVVGYVLGIRMKRYDEWDRESTDYPSADAACTYLLADRLMTRLRAEGLEHIYRDIELPCVPVLAHMEMAGVRIDTEQLVRVEAELEASAQDIEARYPSVVMSQRNSKAAYLFEELGLPVIERTDTGLASVKKVVLEALDHPAAKDMLEWSALNKLLTSYVRPLPRMLHADGRVHGKFTQAGAYEDHDEGEATSTGRINSYDPNLQQIPHRTPLGRRVRAVYVPAPGWVFVKADIGQEEPRIGAFLSGDERLLAQYARGEDVYLPIAQRLHDIAQPTEQLDVAALKGDALTRWRYPAKQLFLAKLYGAGAPKLRSTCLTHSIPMTMEQARSLDAWFVANYPGITAFAKKQRALCERDGYVTTYFGRKRWLYGIWGNKQQREEAARRAANMPVQGTGGDIIKLWMPRVFDGLTESIPPDSWYLPLTVHDELVGEVKEQYADLAADIFRSGTSGLMPIELPVEVEVKPYWA